MSTITIHACFLRIARRQNVFVTTNHHKLRHEIFVHENFVTSVSTVTFHHRCYRCSQDWNWTALEHPIELNFYTLYALKVDQIRVWVRTSNSRKNIFGFGTNEWMLQCKDGSNACDSMAAMLCSNFVFLPFSRFGSGTRSRPELIMNSLVNSVTHTHRTRTQRDGETPERRQYSHAPYSAHDKYSCLSRKLIKFQNSKLKSCLMQSFFVSIKL